MQTPIVITYMDYLGMLNTPAPTRTHHNMYDFVSDQLARDAPYVVYYNWNLFKKA